MVKPKPTSLRILPPEKKTYQAVRYGILGFCTGVIFSAVVFYFYLNSLNHHEVQPHSVSSKTELSEQDILDIQQDTLPISADLATSANQAAVQVNHPKQQEDHSAEYIQPQDIDLMKVFKHHTESKPTTKTSNAIQNHVQLQQHPTHNNAVAKTTKKAITAVSNSKTTAVDQLVTPVKITAKEVETDELPPASVKISVIRSPKVQPETAVAP